MGNFAVIRVKKADGDRKLRPSSHIPGQSPALHPDSLVETLLSAASRQFFNTSSNSVVRQPFIHRDPAHSAAVAANVLLRWTRLST